MPISLGFGSTYCGTLKMVSNSSAPPIRTMATTVIASTSVTDLMPGPAEKAERLVMPTSPPSPELALNSGMASLLFTVSSLGSYPGRQSRNGKTALLLADDLQLDCDGEVEHLLGGHDLERARARER